MNYKGYQYRIFQKDGYYHWTLDIDNQGATVTSLDQQGNANYGGKDSNGKAQQAVKSYINMLKKRGY